MKVVVLRETQAGETRVALVPESVRKLTGLKAQVAVESGAGLEAGATDEDYTNAGAEVSSDRDALLSSADVLVAVNRPDADDQHEYSTAVRCLRQFWPGCSHG